MDVDRKALHSIVADRIQAEMGPVFGSPEYLADPIKLARAQRRQRDAAERWAEIAIDALAEASAKTR